MATPKNYLDTVYLRIPVYLQDEIKTIGDKNHRTLNEMIVEILREYKNQQLPQVLTVTKYSSPRIP